MERITATFIQLQQHSLTVVVNGCATPVCCVTQLHVCVVLNFVYTVLPLAHLYIILYKLYYHLPGVSLCI